MLPKKGKPKRKPTSRGQRKHVRRMKQEARRGYVPDNKLKKVIPAQAVPKP
jgi:hypothetical protein